MSWNAEAGRVAGRITRLHTSDLDYKACPLPATLDDPQCEIRSERTDYIVAQKGSALKIPQV